MGANAVIFMESIIILLMFFVFVRRFLGGRRVLRIVREPRKPQEASLEYTPPPPPKLTLDAVKKIAYRYYIKREFSGTIDKITDHVYLARAFAPGGVIMIITDEGLVIIDTSVHEQGARRIFGEFRKITDKPVKFIIYTHAHTDHIHGTSVFLEPGAEIISTKESVRQMDKDLGWLRGYHGFSRGSQVGRHAKEYALRLPLKGRQSQVNFEERKFIKPTITFDEEYFFSLGGTKFELYHTQGETPDHLMVWMPEERILFPGDLYYASFPNLSSPMLEPRPVRGWYESLERMISLNARCLVPCHTQAVIGEENVREALTWHSNAIQHVYNETVKAINQGKSVDEAVRSIKLPEEMARRPQLEETYGRVDWSVRGIYQGLTGWYDGRGTGLNPLPPGYLAREITGLAGGADKILGRAIELQGDGDHQLVCELCDVVIKANPEDKLARVVKSYSLDYLGYQGGNLNMFGFYRSAAALEREAAGVKPFAAGSAIDQGPEEAAEEK